ncbi:sulfur globule protein precursor, partial [Methylocella silvestris]
MVAVSSLALALPVATVSTPAAAQGWHGGGWHGGGGGWRGGAGGWHGGGWG